MWKLRVIGVLLLAAILPAGAQTMNTPAASALNKADQRLVIAIARADMAEIGTGKLALANSQDAQVKAYAQQMVDDHSKTLADVTALAQNKGVNLPGAPDAAYKARVARLGKLKGSKFDRAYLAQAGVAGLEALKKGAARATDPDLKALAAKMLPTVEQHVRQAPGAKPVTR